MNEKKRVIILTDISSIEPGKGEPDDAQSLIRFLFYANEFDVEGIIATYTSHGQCIFPQHIHTIIGGYQQVLPSLLKHNPHYPSAEQLASLVKTGSSVIGMDHIGADHDTEASEHIISIVDKQDCRPVWILIWGGAIDLAQALWKVSHTRTPQAASLFKQKLRIYAIADQYDETSKWINSGHPDIFYITSTLSFRGMYQGGNQLYCQPEWIREHICLGALGSLYPIYDGKDPWGDVKGLKEGDTPSFLHLLFESPGAPEYPTVAGWGGQFIHSGNQFFDLENAEEAKTSVSMWREAFQLDFAKRVSWSLDEKP